MNANPSSTRIMHKTTHALRLRALPLFAAAALSLAAGPARAQASGQAPTEKWDVQGGEPTFYDPSAQPRPKPKTKRNVVPIVLGASFFGTSYVGGLMYALIELGLNSVETDEALMAPPSLAVVALPCFGPFIAAASNDKRSRTLIGLGVVQTLSFSTLIYGLATPKRAPETSSSAPTPPSIQIGPIVGGTLIGLQMSGSF